MARLYSPLGTVLWSTFNLNHSCSKCIDCHATYILMIFNSQKNKLRF